MGQRFSNRLRCAKHSSRRGERWGDQRDRCIYYHRPVAHARAHTRLSQRDGMQKAKVDNPTPRTKERTVWSRGLPWIRRAGDVPATSSSVHAAVELCLKSIAGAVPRAGPPAADGDPSGYPPGWCRFWTHSPRALCS